MPQLPLSQQSVPSLIESTPPDPSSTSEDKSAVASVERDTLPPDLLSSFQSSLHILERDFTQSPPYTIQRLAELVLQPKKHYKFLPAYLRALDRVISVSSPVTDFPLPSGIANGNSSFLTNGDLDQLNGIQEREGLGSDESLGGALLTPIPWLRNNMLAQTDGEFRSERMDTILGPNGAGSIETVSVTVNGISSAAHTSPSTSTPASPTLSEQSDASTNSSGSISTEAQLREQGGVTQGELLRQEQEAGVIPVAQTRRVEVVEEETPHARGPEIIGMEDTGLVQGANDLDMAAAVGRAHSKSPQPPPSDAEEEESEGDMLIDNA